VPSVARALLEDREAVVSPGAQVRDFLHVDDAAGALWAIATSAARGAVNVGSGQPVTVADIARSLGAIADRPDLVKLGALPYRLGDPMFVCADVRRLTEQCGWKPRFQLESGLRNTIEWWRAQSAQSPGSGGE
jgi:nucleoside-diphosphate-sugar epimerase